MNQNKKQKRNFSNGLLHIVIFSILSVLLLFKIVCVIHNIQYYMDSRDYIVVTAAADGDYRLANDYKTKVILVGRELKNELSYIFCKEGQNRFITYGEKDELLSDAYSCLVWRVCDWKILAPIKRSYDILEWDARKERRKSLSPFCFDDYDIEYSDFNPILYDELRMDDREQRYWEKQKEYYRICQVPTEAPGTWEVIQDNNHKRIHLLGDIPENHFNEDILCWNYNENLRLKGNEFIVKGHLLGDKLYIEKWWICIPFVRYKNDERSRFGFIETDYVEGVVR